MVRVLLSLALILACFILFTIPMDETDAESRKKLTFSGNHDMIFHGEPKVDFSVDPLTYETYIIEADVRIGNDKRHLFGGGILKPTYGYYDRQCKSLQGTEYLFSNHGDFVMLSYFGKVCYVGNNIKTVTMVFEGKDASGLFEDAEIRGTLTGSSDKYETKYNLFFNSILIYEN